MKKVTIALFLAAGAISLLGCNNHYQLKEHRFQPMQQSYQGLLPCADCTSLDTALFLDKDGTFLLQETYRDSKNGDQTFVSNGKWACTADKLVLTDSTGEKRYFRPAGKSLEMLDQSGAPIESKLNYRLNPSEQPWPKTRGGGLKSSDTSMADTALFKDMLSATSFR